MKLLRILSSIGVVAASLAIGAPALAQSTVFFTNKGDLAFPLLAPTREPTAPGKIDNMAIGQTIPESAKFTTVEADTITAQTIQQSGPPSFDQSVEMTFASTATAPTLVLKNATPQFDLWNTAGAADSKRWNLFASATSLSLRALTDNGSTGSNAWVATRTAGVVTQQQLFTSGDPRITVDSIGNVGIGIDNPEAPLAIAGAFTVAAGSVSTEWNPTSGTDLTVGAVSNHPVNIIANGTTRLTVAANGDLAAGAGYAPANALSLATKTYVDTSALSSITASQRIARGETAVTGTGTAATGLTAIASCTTSIKVGTAPGVGTSVVTYTTAGATLNLFAWKPTDNTNPTLVAATDAATIGWQCIGT